jgi:hypothetical protein
VLWQEAEGRIHAGGNATVSDDADPLLERLLLCETVAFSFLCSYGKFADGDGENCWRQKIKDLHTSVLAGLLVRRRFAAHFLLKKVRVAAKFRFCSLHPRMIVVFAYKSIYKIYNNIYSTKLISLYRYLNLVFLKNLFDVLNVAHIFYKFG